MNNQTPREILTQFYKDNGFGMDGGVSSKSVKIEITKNFHFWYPNFEARNKAVLKHDIHHLLTGYSTKLTGEGEISAWEIGTGCKKYWAAFLLDTSGFSLGTPIYFWGILKAFARGRRTKSLYHDLFTNEEALDMKISDLQSALLLDKYGKDTKPNFIDCVLFVLLGLFALVYSLSALVLLPFIIVYSIYIALRSK